MLDERIIMDKGYLKNTILLGIQTAHKLEDVGVEVAFLLKYLLLLMVQKSG